MTADILDEWIVLHCFQCDDDDDDDDESVRWCLMKSEKEIKNTKQLYREREWWYSQCEKK